MSFLPLKHYRWALDDTARAEALLLQQLFKDEQRDFTTDKQTSPYEVFDVPLPNKAQICTLRIPARSCSTVGGDFKDETSPKLPLLLLHGFAAGKSVWAPLLRQLASFAKTQDRVIYAIDLPGMGCSSEFGKMQKGEFKHITAENGERLNKTDPVYAARMSRRAIQYYVEAIHAWAVEVGIEKMVVMGHSLGATLAAAFVHAHPSLVEKLIMISPVGLESQPQPWYSCKLDERTVHHTPPFTNVDKFIWYLWTKYHITPLALARFWSGPLLPYAIKAFARRSELYSWARKDKKLEKYAWMYTYATIRHRSSAEALMPYFITGTGSAVAEDTNLLPDILREGVHVTVLRGSNDWVPPLRAQDEFCKLGMKVIVLDKAEHSLHLVDPEKAWPLIEAEL